MLIGAGEKLIQTKNEENINLAEKKFLQALKVRPRFFDAYLRYADSYIANEYTEQASEKLKVYRDLKGENFEWLMATGRLLRSEGRLDGNDSASTFFERARRKDPASFEALDGLANIDFLAGRVDKSRTLYAEYVKKHPRHVQAQFRLLEILVSQENTLGAEQKWREILRLKNKNLDPAITTAFARLYIDKSIPFERNRSTKTIPVPFLSTKYTNVTPAFVRDEYRIRAYNVLQRVLRKYPHFAPAWFQQARLALLRRNLFSAKRSIDMAVKNDAMKPEYHTLLGEILRRQELPEQALKAFRDAIDADPEYLLSHYFLANLIYETEPDNNGGARSEYLQTYELLPSAPPEQRVEVDEEMVYYRLGWLSYNASDYEDAVRMWTLYFKYNELNPAVNLCRGTAHFNLGNYDLAIQDLEAAVSSYRALTAETKIVEPNKPYDQELYRDLSAAYNNLGISYAVIGKTRPALLNLYQSIESIKTLGFFNENEQANVNLQLVLHPTRDSVSQLIPVEQLPRDHILSE
jgi:tetratricopeptide (TPR) repeat protein